MKTDWLKPLRIVLTLLALVAWLPLAACLPLAGRPQATPVVEQTRTAAIPPAPTTHTLPPSATPAAAATTPEAVTPQAPLWVPALSIQVAVTQTLTAVAAQPSPAISALPTATAWVESGPSLAMPTPVPLPEVCLLEAFSNDVANCGAIPQYDITLAVDMDAARVSGRQTVRYTNLEDEPLEAIYLRLLPNAPGYGGAMTVTHLLVDGQMVTPTLEVANTALRLPLAAALEVGQAVELDMDFEVAVPTSGAAGHALFSYLRGVMSLPTVYPIIPVYDHNGWNIALAPEYADDVYADVAIYRVQIAAPAGLTLAVSGSCGQPQIEGDLATWTCEAAPMRDFVLILSDRYDVANRQVGDVVVNSFYYREHQAGGAKALEVAAASLEIFAELFGPYPYAELDVLETPNHLGGMEYASLVVVKDALYPGLTGVEWLTAHEVAHQWWFAVVGNDPVRDPWLDEALTQYSTMLYYEKRYGETWGAGIVESAFVETHRELERQGRDLPAGLTAGAYGPVLYWQIVYDKGALYFHNLRQAVGDKTFFAILQAYYNRHRYRIATPADFLDVVEEIAGNRYEGIYERWIGAGD